MPVIAPPIKERNAQIEEGIINVYSHCQKAWYEVPHIEVKDGTPVIVTETIETWFPERWEKKNAKANFIKKNEVTYKMSIPEADLIDYAFDQNFIEEEPEND